MCTGMLKELAGACYETSHQRRNVEMTPFPVWPISHGAAQFLWLQRLLH